MYVCVRVSVCPVIKLQTKRDSLLDSAVLACVLASMPYAATVDFRLPDCPLTLVEAHCAQSCAV